MKHIILITIWCLASIITAVLDSRHDAKLETLWQQKNLSITARDLNQNLLPVILPRSPSGGPLRPAQARESSRSQSQGTAPQRQSPRPSNTNLGPGRSQEQVRERSRSPTRSRSLLRNNSPTQSDASNQPGSPTRSDASNRRGGLGRSNSSNQRNSLAQDQPSNRESALARSRSQSPAGSGSTLRANLHPIQSQNSARSRSSRSTSSSSESSGPLEFPIGPQGQIPFPYDTIPPTKSAGRVHGPAILAKGSPFLGTEGGTVPPGIMGQISVVNPYKSRVVGIARQGVSLAVAHGDTASARVRTGPDSWGRLTATTPEGLQVKHVSPNSYDKIRAQTNEPGLTPAKATVQLVGQGTFRARGRNLR